MNRKDLAATVERQKDQISRYETKLRDVVRAYKALQKERDALQTGLSALSTSNASPSTTTSPSTNTSAEGSSNVSEGKDSSQAVAETDTNSESEGRSSVQESDETKSDDSVHSQLKSLSLALTEMTAEKEKMQKNFMMERKKLNDDKDKVLLSLQKSMDAEEAVKKQVIELHQKILRLQSERDADTDQAALRLRECQKVLSEQREAREKLELLLQQTQHKLLQKNKQQSVSKHESDTQSAKQIIHLRNTLQQFESKVKGLEADLKSKGEQLKQMEQFNATTVTQLHQESLRVQESERELARVLVSSRERESTLEARLTEAASCLAAKTSADASLSTNFLNYKAKIRDLSEQNHELTQKLSMTDQNRKSENIDSENFFINLSMEKQINILKKLWLHVNLQCLSSHQQQELEKLMGGSEAVHENCKQKQRELMQQLAQLQQPENSHKSSSQEKKSEERESSSQLQAAREELRHVTASSQVTADAHTAQIDSLKQEIRSVRAEYEERLLSSQQSQRSVVCSLEQQLTSQRLHSIATLQERDMELHRLQQQLHTLNMENTQAKVPSALVSSTSSRSGPLLHHVEELQRREREVTSLQHEKMQLENAVREVQTSAIEKRMAQEERLQHLEEQLVRFERNQSRESQNLEYLKNVILHFLTSANSINGDVYSKASLVKAVAAVLKLSPQEEDRLRHSTEDRRAEGGNWWLWGNSGKRS